MRPGLVLLGWTAALALTAAGAIPVDLAQAERVRGGNLVMSLSGGIAPLRLPRHRAAPAAAALASRVTTNDRTPVPKLRRIEVAFGAGASISSAGLPICPRARLLNATRTEALRRCGGALVGLGRLPLEVRFPGQPPLRRAPRMLVFNGRGPGGGTVLWIHTFVARPPVSFVLAFHVHRSVRSFATVLAASVPASIASWIRIRGFDVTLHRRYRWHGRARSYLSASCPVPLPFTAGFFSFARTTYRFAGDRRLTNAIVRSCRVKP
ncbi:MAG TPA: hypothetical protein VF125_02980 [Solirubrobacterales bacterium]